MDRTGDKQHWNQHCQPFANLSLGLSERVAEWTGGSELLVLLQRFHPIRFLCKRNLQINPGLTSWQKVLVIFRNISLEEVTYDPSCISSDPVPPSSSVCQGWCWRKGTAIPLPQGQVTEMDRANLASAGAVTGIAVCVCRTWTHQPFQNGWKMSNLTQKKREKVCVYQARI